MPFTVEQFLNSIATYNHSVWPAQVVLNAAGIGIAFLLWKRRGGAVVAVALAALWIWMGLAYHYRVFSAINPAAYLFAAAFFAEGALILWFGLARRSLRLDASSRSHRNVGLALIIYALIVYPFTAWIDGHVYPQLPTFGLPCPTLIFTFGVLAFGTFVPWQLFVIPTLWAVVGVSAALNLGMLEDLALLPAALLVIGVRMSEVSMSVRARRIARQALLGFGIASSLLYLITDLVGGLAFEGYSFTSQAISELMAAGAPSERVVDPLFLLGGLLSLGFGIGVWRDSADNRRLRVAAAAIIAFAVLGLSGPIAFEMHPRGSAAPGADIGHIVLTAILVVLTLTAMGSAAGALGRRFRAYTIATVVLVIALGALSAPYGSALAAGEPTPGFGIIERMLVYACQLWFAILAVAVLRRPADARVGRAPIGPRLAPSQLIHGFVAPGFEEVRTEFLRNFAHRGEIGAAVAAYWRGEKVVDLWGGYRSPDSLEPWTANTMVVVMSTTKGLSAMTLALANSRGWLKYDAPVARYWPEFSQNGKAGVTVRQLLNHEAGLVLLDEKLPVERLFDHNYVARVLERQKPAWQPGTRHGYHTLTIGLCMQELVRRVDPAHRTLGRFFHEEIALPLGLEFYIGLPKEIPDERIATLQTLTPWRGLKALRYTPLAMTLRMITPGSLLRRSFVGTNVDYRDRKSYEVEIPAGNGVGTARAIARAYSAFAEGGAELGITPETFAEVLAPPVVHGDKDVVLGVPSYFSLGFLRPSPQLSFGSSEHAFGAPGAGGSFAFADPDARLGYAYVMNKLDFYLTDDPREKALRDAIYRAIRSQRHAEQADLDSFTPSSMIAVS